MRRVGETGNDEGPRWAETRSDLLVHLDEASELLEHLTRLFLARRLEPGGAADDNDQRKHHSQLVTALDQTPVADGLILTATDRAGARRLPADLALGAATLGETDAEARPDRRPG